MDRMIPGNRCHWQEKMLGAFVLGALDVRPRAAFRAHLDGCAECRAEVRELEPVSRSLAESAPEIAAAAGPRPPADLAERTLALVGRARRADISRRRRRRIGRTGLAAVAATLVVAVGLFALVPRLTGPSVEPVAFSEVAPGVEAEAGLISHGWGTETRLVASGLKDGQTYKLVFLDEDGAPASSGAFYGTGNRPVECSFNAALERGEATGLEVRSASGELVLGADLPENPRRADRGPWPAVALPWADQEPRGDTAT